jgi:hypothetical protein
VGDQRRFDPFVAQVFHGGDHDLFTQLNISPFLHAVFGPIGERQAVGLGLFQKFNYLDGKEIPGLSHRRAAMGQISGSSPPNCQKVTPFTASRYRATN